MRNFTGPYNVKKQDIIENGKKVGEFYGSVYHPGSYRDTLDKNGTIIARTYACDKKDPGSREIIDGVRVFGSDGLVA